MNIQASPSGKYKLTILKTEPRNSVGQVFLGDKLELLHQWKSERELKRIADYEVWIAPFI